MSEPDCLVTDEAERMVRTKTLQSCRLSVRVAVSGLRGEVTFHASLREFTSLRIGGPAEALVIPEDVEDLGKLVRQAYAAQVPLFVLGGTNLLVRDGGLLGIVVSLSKFSMIQDESRHVVYAEGGVRMPVLVRHAISRSLSGLEWAAGIPGTVGGSVVMNAGTRLGEMKDSLQAIRLVDLQGQERVHTASSIAFSYRHADIPKGVVVGAWLNLVAAPRTQIERTTKDYLRYRKNTQPLTRPNAGSVFKNPGPQTAGQLIEEAGLKGTRIGDAQISEKHANFIVNLGQARATDVQLLIQTIQQTVFQQTGVSLDPEITIVGES
ncbi:MAG: UDP-N-acetylmuramate dehydrogenase [Nitrospirales bacterium]|nr:UDP-N-acetylmuramate dehydrogenase [Nitrospirales bacterium]